MIQKRHPKQCGSTPIGIEGYKGKDKADRNASTVGVGDDKLVIYSMERTMHKSIKYILKEARQDERDLMELKNETADPSEYAAAVRHEHLSKYTLDPNNDERRAHDGNSLPSDHEVIMAALDLNGHLRHRLGGNHGQIQNTQRRDQNRS